MAQLFLQFESLGKKISKSKFVKKETAFFATISNFLNPTQCLKPLIFQTMHSVKSLV